MRLATIADAFGHFRNFLRSKFVRAFGPDRFILCECYGASRAANPDGLIAQGSQVHFDAPFRAVVARFVTKRRKIKIGIQFAIDTGEQVEIERGRDAD